MRAMGLIAVAILAATGGAARADSFDVGDLFRRTEGLVQSVLGPGQDRGREVIVPPGNIDPRMAFEPPDASGTLRIIRPPERPEQRR
jgi:hypothetical protein